MITCKRMNYALVIKKCYGIPVECGFMKFGKASHIDNEAFFLRIK